jgi:hypothetical protein
VLRFVEDGNADPSCAELLEEKVVERVEQIIA